MRRNGTIYHEEWDCRAVVEEGSVCKFGRRAEYDSYKGTYSCRDFCKDTYYKSGDMFDDKLSIFLEIFT